MAVGELLPEEQLLWSGRPARAGISLGDAGFSLYLLVALVFMGVLAPRFVQHLPSIFVAMVAIAWGGGALQTVGQLVYLLVLRPRIRSRAAYHITDRRILVTTGLSRRHTSSAYLDQIDEPSLERQRDGAADLRLQARQEPLVRKLLAEGIFSAANQPDTPLLHDVAEAEQVRQIVTEARRRMLAGGTEARPPDAADGNVPLPEAIRLAQTERLLWAGCAGKVPWWFGLEDIYISVFGLVWLAFVSLMGVWAATGGSAWFLIFLVPFAAAGGLYPAAGRLMHRRIRIRRSTYVLTDRRLIAAWCVTEPVVVQAALNRLLPPEIRGPAIFTRPAQATVILRRSGWKNLLWPTATSCPPTLIGVDNPRAVRDLICAAQLAARPRKPASRAGSS
jgi:hypothetical protein